MVTCWLMLTFLIFSYLSPLVLSVLGQHEALPNSNLALLTENFLHFCILQEKGELVSWWYQLQCSGWVASGVPLRQVTAP